MFNQHIIWAILGCYMIFVFIIALWGERRAAAGKSIVNNPIAYSLSILVYLTAWTFYGSVGKAATSGSLFLTFYIGPTLIMVIWYSFLRKIVRIKNTFLVTSIADFVSLRYDRSLLIAAMVTIIALVGVIPYIALQLKAILGTLDIITNFPNQNSVVAATDFMGVIVCLLIILFTIMLGVRRQVPTERHQGMVVAMVLESVIKLTGFLAVGVFVTFSLFDGFGDIFLQFKNTMAYQDLIKTQSDPSFSMMWMSYLLLSMSAFMFLPRQFHMTVVENFKESHIRSAMWICPLYLLLITVFIMPIAMGGLLLGLPTEAADTFVLMIPLESGQRWLSLLVFIAGFSASTGMIMICSMTISTMMTNHLLLPVLEWIRPLASLKHYLLQFRWLSVGILVMTGYWLKNNVGLSFTLVDFGVIAFVSVLQFVPSVVGGLYWRRGHKNGAMLGMGSGFIIWFYTLILPLFARSGMIPESILNHGPWNLNILRPEQLFYLNGLDSTTHAVFWSMFFNIGLYVLASLKSVHTIEEDRLADAFVDALVTPLKPAQPKSDLIVDPAMKRIKIHSLFSQYFTTEKADELTNSCFKELNAKPDKWLSILELAELNRIIEMHLASAIGAATAHQALMNSDVISPDEESALYAEYSNIIARLKLAPSDLKNRVNYYQEKEKLLSQQAIELETKIRERDREIAERRRVEEILRNSERQLADLINFHPDPTFAIDLEGKITIWNRAAEEFTGTKAIDIIGKGNYEYSIPFYGERRPILIDLVFKPAEEIEQLYPHLSRIEGIVSGETSTRSVKKGNAYLLGTAAPLYDSEGRICGAIESIRDITERRKEEEELFHSRQMLQLVLDNVPQRIFWKDIESVYMGCNKALASDCGYVNPDDLVGKTDFDTASAAMAELYRADDRLVMETGIAKVNYEELQIRSDGSRAWLRTTKIPLRDETSRVIAILGIYEDITQRRIADEEIRRLNRVYAVLSDMNQMIVRVRNRQNLLDEVCRIAIEVGGFQLAAIGNFESARAECIFVAYYGRCEEDRFFFNENLVRDNFDWNPGFRQLILSGKPFISNDLEADCCSSRWIQRALQLGYRSMVAMPVLAPGKTGRVIILFSTIHAFFDSTEIRLLEEVVADVSFALESLDQEEQRRQAEFALQKSEDRYRSLVENLQEVVFTIDLDGLITYISPAICTLTDYQPDEVFGSSFERFLHPDDVSDVRASFFRTLEGNLEPLEFRILDKAGAVHWIRSSSTPQFADDRLIGLLGIFTDITAHKRSESEIRQRLIELEAVHKVSVALRSAMNIDDMLTLFLSETLKVVGSESGCIWLMNSETDAINHRVERGWCASITKESIDRRKGISGKVLSTGESFLSSDFSKEPEFQEPGFNAVPRGWGGVCVPVRTAELIIGLLLVSVKLPRIMTREEERLLITLSEIVGNSIHRISLHERTHRQVRHLNALHTIDRAITGSMDLTITIEILLEQVLMISGADAADVVILNLDTQKIICLTGKGFQSVLQMHREIPLGSGLASQVILSRKPVFIGSNLHGEADHKATCDFPEEGFKAYHAWPLIAKGQVKGVLEVFHRRPFHPGKEWLDFLSALASQAAVAIDNTFLLDALQTSNQELMVAYDATLEGWARALELHDQETEGHSRRVIDMTILLARSMGIEEREIVHIRRGALLHDIGKMGIPDEILKKPGNLTEEEWRIMMKHPEYAFKMLYPIHYLRPALDIPYAHHEKWNGTGYPRNLKKEKIPFAARVFSVVDVYDALLSARPYRNPWPVEKVVDFISSQSGEHFDPEVVACFLRIIKSANLKPGKFP